MPGFVNIGPLHQVREGCGALVHCAGLDIALFKREGSFFAINNVCAHQHFSMLHKGQSEGFRVTCPMHGWTYDLRTGKATTGEGSVASYPVRIEGENLFIELPGETV